MCRVAARSLATWAFEPAEFRAILGGKVGDQLSELLRMVH